MTEGTFSRLFQRKKPIVNPTLPTPILDLVEPLPKPADEIVTSKFAFPLLTFVVIVAATQNYAFLIVPLGVLPALLLVVAVHECGHLVFGWCTGLRFRRVEIGPF
jgi:hypothetical protein